MKTELKGERMLHLHPSGGQKLLVMNANVDLYVEIGNYC